MILEKILKALGRIPEIRDASVSSRKCHRIAVRFAALVCMIVPTAIPYTLKAQDFNCEVSVNDSRVSGQFQDDIREFGPELERYVNENRWSGDNLDHHERIRCQIQVILIDVDSQNNYEAEVVFHARRPVYSTMQESTSVLLVDSNWNFHYQRNRSLIRDDLQFDDVTSFFDFYMYILLGFDYDSFTELGGSPYYGRALEILEIAQTFNSSGWGQGFGNQRNRYRLISDLTSPAYEEFRRSFYQYHRLGLDRFTSDPEAARAQVIEAIEGMRDNRDSTGRNYLFDLFFDAKYREIAAMFESAPARVRLEAYNLLLETDPGHSGEYERLR